MRVIYEGRDTEALCTTRELARREFGEAGAKKLGRRIKELESAITVEDVMSGPGRWHRLKGDRAGTVAADVTGTVRLIVKFQAPDVVVLAVGNEYH